MHLWVCDAVKAIEQLDKLSISIHCWQADDVSGFENPDGELTGGIQTTGNYPGKARTIEELKEDLEKVINLIPGNHRISLHATYGDFGGEFVDRDLIEPKHFQSWIDWAKEKGVKLDFNSTFSLTIRQIVGIHLPTSIRKYGNSGKNICVVVD